MNLVACVRLESLTQYENISSCRVLSWRFASTLFGKTVLVLRTVHPLSRQHEDRLTDTDICAT